MPQLTRSQPFSAAAWIDGPDVGGGFSVGQAFTATSSGRLEHVDLLLQRTAASHGPLTVELRDVLPSGDPGENTLASAVIPAAAVSVERASAVTVPMRAPVLADCRYAIVAHTGDANHYGWAARDAGASVFSRSSPPRCWNGSILAGLALTIHVGSGNGTWPGGFRGARAR